MILKGNQRGGARQLAAHLLNDHDNDHIEVHAVNGFVAQDVSGALEEIYAVSRATNCKQFMFSLSLSPPENATVQHIDFENAIEDAAERLGLKNQPHIILFHEKNGRRHCHAVFSRIDTEQMKAINLPFYKERLNELAKELYLTHGWELPNGFKNRSLSDPLNYTLEEYNVAKNAKRDPREIKAAIQQCWQQSDGKQAFAAALQDKGFYLCKGDRRGFVALDWKGNIYSLSRWTGVRPNKLKQRLGDPAEYQSINETRHRISQMMDGKRKEFAEKLEADFARKLAPLEDQRMRLVKRQRMERRKLSQDQKLRRQSEAHANAKRLRKGLLGLWDWVSGKRRKIIKKNAEQLEITMRRDQTELLHLVKKQRSQRAVLHRKRMQLSKGHETAQISLDKSFYEWGAHRDASSLHRDCREHDIECETH